MRVPGASFSPSAFAREDRACSLTTASALYGLTEVGNRTGCVSFDADIVEKCVLLEPMAAKAEFSGWLLLEPVLSSCRSRFSRACSAEAHLQQIGYIANHKASAQRLALRTTMVPTSRRQARRAARGNHYPPYPLPHSCLTTVKITAVDIILSVLRRSGVQLCAPLFQGNSTYIEGLMSRHCTVLSGYQLARSAARYRNRISILTIAPFSPA